MTPHTDGSGEYHNFWSGYLVAGLLSAILWLGIVYAVTTFLLPFLISLV